MPYYPITGAPSQYEKANESPADGYYLKFYASGTSTPVFAAANTTATDENGLEQLFDKIKLNANGYPINASGGVIVPHLDVAYKIVLYKTAADANANLTSSADWIVDGLSPGLIGLPTEDAVTSAADIEYIADPTAAISDVEAKLQEFYSVKDFGALADGSTDDSVAIATALLIAKDLYFPSGTYLCGGVLVQTANTNIHFGGNVVLKANDNNLVMFRQITSDCDHTGTFEVDDNGKSGIIGMRVGPSDPTSTSVLAQVERNTLPGIVGDAGVTDLVVIQCGPKVSATFSYTRNNVFPKIVGNGCTRAVHFRAAANATADVPRSNNLMLVEVGPTSQHGVEIDAGSSNTIHSLRADSCSVAGFEVANVCPTTSIANDNNVLLSGYAVNCTKDVINANPTTQLVAFDYSRTNSTITAKPIKHALAGNQLHNIYFGSVNSGGGTAKNLPSGWSTSNVGGGRYRITHNLGVTTYDFVALATSDNQIFANGFNLDANSFDLQIVDNSNIARDANVAFIVWRY